MQTPPPADQRVALVIGNSNYQTAPKLANPGNDAQSMAQLLNSAGFEVTQATDLTRNDMVRVVQDFTAKVAERGPGTVAMIYYAGHGVQLDGRELSASGRCENLVAVRSRRQLAATGRPDGDAGHRSQAGCASSCSTPAATIRSRRSTTPGGAWPSSMRRTARSSATRPRRAWKRQDGDGNHSPYTSAFLNIAREPNLPIEQLFKRVRLEVNNATRRPADAVGKLVADLRFLFLRRYGGRRRPRAGSQPDRADGVEPALAFGASGLRLRAVRRFAANIMRSSSGSIRTTRCATDIRVLLGNLQVATAWHKAVLANSPVAYKIVPRQLRQQPLRASPR